MNRSAVVGLYVLLGTGLILGNITYFRIGMLSQQVEQARSDILQAVQQSKQDILQAMQPIRVEQSKTPLCDIGLVLRAAGIEEKDLYSAGQAGGDKPGARIQLRGPRSIVVPPNTESVEVYSETGKSRTIDVKPGEKTPESLLFVLTFSSCP